MSNEGLSYQMFEEYYARAKIADQQNKNAEAKKLYLYASEALYKAAKDVKGETQSKLIERAKKLEILSDAITVDDKTAVSSNASSSTVSAPKKAKESVSSSRGNDESNTAWVPSERPNIHFDDIAGLQDVKEAINTKIILPRKYPEVYAAYNRSQNGGILLYGPPGTGKTMVAKAIATEVDAAFYAVRCSDIVGKYFGEAERNIKGLFEAARAQKSAILFFDEFEALATRRGGNSTVMNRLVPELLSQIDGFTTTKDKNFLLLAATNRPWDLDTAFLRPPRLTEKIYLGLPDAEARLYLIMKKLKGVPCDDSLCMEDIVESTEGFNAADVDEFCECMKDGAIERTILEEQGLNLSLINIDDYERATEKVRSSVQTSDIQAIKQWESKQR